MGNIIISINKRILYFLFITSFIAHTNFVAQFPLYVKITKLTIFLIIIIWLSSHYYKRIFIKRSCNFSIQELLIISFTLLALLSGLLNFNHYMDVSEPLVFGSFVLFLYLYLTKSEIKINIYNFLLLSTIFSCIGFTYSLSEAVYNYLQYSPNTSIEVFVSTSSNWNGFFTNPNRFGSLMMVGFMTNVSLLCINIPEMNPRKIIPGILIFFYLAGALLLSQSRTSMFGAGIFTFGTVFLFIIKQRSSIFKNNKLWIIFISVTCLSLYVFSKLNLFQNVLKKMDQGTSYRYGFWKAFLTDRFENFNSLTFFIGEGYTKNVNLLSDEYNLHNGFLEIFGHFGLPALIIFTLLLINQMAINIKKSIWYIYFFTYGFLAYSLFESIIFFTSYSVETFAFLIFLFYKYSHTNYQHDIKPHLFLKDAQQK